MTVTEAYSLLLERWPAQHFSIDVRVSRYEHLLDDPPYVEYTVWDGRRRELFTGPTLAMALALALGEQSSLAEVDTQTEGLALIQGGRP